MFGSFRQRLLVLGVWLFVPYTPVSAIPAVDYLFTGIVPAEISVGNFSGVKDQGTYNYCTLYAMTSYLEALAEEKHERKEEPLSVSHLAIAYNLEFGNALNGSHEDWVVYVVKKYGVLPISAWSSLPPKEWDAYFPEGWEKAHEKLIPEEIAKAILAHPFRWREGGLDTKRFLDDYVGIDLKKLVFVDTQHVEPLKAEASAEGGAKFLYRIEDATKRAEHRKAVFEAEGLPTANEKLDAAELVKAIAKQVNDRKPVLLNLNTHLAKESFANLSLLPEAGLRKAGEGSMGNHTMVAVGECDTYESALESCKPYTAAMKANKVEKCLILQNSWGMGSHQKGHVCVEHQALRRMLWNALLPKP